MLHDAVSYELVVPVDVPEGVDVRDSIDAADERLSSRGRLWSSDECKGFARLISAAIDTSYLQAGPDCLFTLLAAAVVKDDKDDLDNEHRSALSSELSGTYVGNLLGCHIAATLFPHTKSPPSDAHRLTPAAKELRYLMIFQSSLHVELKHVVRDAQPTTTLAARQFLPSDFFARRSARNYCVKVGQEYLKRLDHAPYLKQILSIRDVWEKQLAIHDGFEERVGLGEIVDQLGMCPLIWGQR